MAEQGGHIAEIARERTAPRELDAHRGVAPAIGQLPQGNRCLVDIRKLGRRVDTLGAAALQIRQKRRQSQFGFIEDKVVHGLKVFLVAGEQGAAGDHHKPGFLAAGNDFERFFALHDHGADERTVGPGEVPVRQPSHVEVDQAFAPRLGQQRRHGEQSKGRQRSLFANKLQGMLEAPERIWKLGI